MNNVKEIWDNGTKGELKEYIESVGADSLGKAEMFFRNDFMLFNEINENEFMNKECCDYLWNGLGLWVWNESSMTTAEEVKEFIRDDDMYCQLYERLITYFNEEDDKENED